MDTYGFDFFEYILGIVLWISILANIYDYNDESKKNTIEWKLNSGWVCKKNRHLMTLQKNILQKIYNS